MDECLYDALCLSLNPNISESCRECGLSSDVAKDYCRECARMLNRCYYCSKNLSEITEHLIEELESLVKETRKGKFFSHLTEGFHQMIEEVNHGRWRTRREIYDQCRRRSLILT